MAMGNGVCSQSEVDWDRTISVRSKQRVESAESREQGGNLFSH